jgi:hypothetical protein
MGNLSTHFPAPTSSNVLEQIVYYADGKTVVTGAGNFTAPNITAITGVTSNSFIDSPGTNIDYTPPAGATKVIYEAFIQGRYYNDTHMSPSLYVELDGTQINQTRRTELQQNTYEMVILALAVICIDGSYSDDIANSKLASWTSAKTIKTKICCYNSSYQFYVNGSYHYAGSAPNLITPPMMKITAIK